MNLYIIVYFQSLLNKILGVFIFQSEDLSGLNLAALEDLSALHIEALTRLCHSKVCHSCSKYIWY